MCSLWEVWLMFVQSLPQKADVINELLRHFAYLAVFGNLWKARLSLTLLLSTRVPFPNKISCFVSTCVSLGNSFPSVRQEPSFRPWKGFPFLQQMATLVGFFFAETDILTTRGTQGPACLPVDQTQQQQLGPFCPCSPPDADNWPECPNR